MLELSISPLIIGFLVSYSKRLGIGNPFQIFFTIWLAVFIAYIATRQSWLQVPAEFFFLLFVVNMAWLAALLVFQDWLVRPKGILDLGVHSVDKRLLMILQVICILVLPLAIIRAKELSGGLSLFSMEGYRSVRSALTNDGIGWGWTKYFIVLSTVVSSVSAAMAWARRVGKIQLMVSLGVSLAYVFLTTGRTAVLLLALVVVGPLVIAGVFGKKHIILVAIGLLFGFVLVAFLTNKGVSGSQTFSENVATFLDSTRAYTVAPMVAFSHLIEANPPQEGGANTFRIFYSIGSALGLNASPAPLVKPFVQVPDLTNVYTVYDPYVRDFGLIGMLFIFVLLLMHVGLYRKALRGQRIYIFFYSASMFPLLLQFFQDMYVSLTSTWIQVAFWYWILFGGPKRFWRVRPRK